jgi:hypothetical protein
MKREERDSHGKLRKQVKEMRNMSSQCHIFCHAEFNDKPKLETCAFHTSNFEMCLFSVIPYRLFEFFRNLPKRNF